MTEEYPDLAAGAYMSGWASFVMDSCVSIHTGIIYTIIEHCPFSTLNLFNFKCFGISLSIYTLSG